MPIADSANKRSITATFIITLNGNFLPVQLIYVSKITQKFPRRKFQDLFSFSVNSSHLNNSTVSVRVMEEIVAPYVEEQPKSLQLPRQAALIIMDMFRGQVAAEVLDILCKAPANMTNFFNHWI